MGMLPGWDAADSAATIAHTLHVAAIIVLGLLVLSEGLALVYDTRKEHLVEIDARAAEARRTAEADRLQRSLSEANAQAASAHERTAALEREAAQLRQAVTWPTISAELGQNLTTRLAAVPASVPRNIMLAWLANDPQTQLLAAQFGEILRRAGWVVVAAQARTYMSPAPLFGIFLQGGTQSEAVQALRDAFSAVGISLRTDAVGGSFTATGSGSMFLNPLPPTLLVGSKGPPF
jgi:hypothetical protein